MVSPWIAIVVLCIGALAMLLTPLVRRRQAASAARVDYDIGVYKDQLKEVDLDVDRGFLDETRAKAARTEIQRRMLAAAGDDCGDDSGETAAPAAPVSNLWVITAIAVFVPLGAVLTYLGLGSPDIRDFPLAGRTDERSPAVNRQDRKMVKELAERMRRNPNDQRGWILLGNSYMAMEQFAQAAEAYGKALEVGEKSADIALNRAEALVYASDSGIPDEALDIFRDVLKANPLDAKSRYYLAFNKARTGDLKGALQDWVDLRALTPKGAPWLETLEKQIERSIQTLGADAGSVKPSAQALELAKSLPPPVDPPPGMSNADAEAISKMTPEQRDAMILSMVESLAAKMEKNPDDAEGWRRLAKAYAVLGDEEKAKQALARAQALTK